MKIKIELNFNAKMNSKPWLKLVIMVNLQY